MDKWLVTGTQWLYRIVKTNLVWVLLVLVGGGILGFFPATIAVARLIRGWFQGKTQAPILKTMWQEYKINFRLGLKLQLLYGSSLLLLLINLRAAFQMNHLYFILITYLLLFFLLLWLSSLLYLFPLIANYEGTCLQYAKQSLALVFKNLKIWLMQVIGLLLLWVLNLEISSLIIFGTTVIWQLYAAYWCKRVLVKELDVMMK